MLLAGIRRNAGACRVTATSNDKYVHVVLLAEVTRNVRAACLPFPWYEIQIHQIVHAFGRSAGVLGGWRLGGSDVVVFYMQPFNMN